MKRIILCAVGWFVLSATATVANAQSCGCASPNAGGMGGGYGEPTVLQTYEASVHENCIWPRQYVWPSRRAICQSFATMTNNGWRRNNLLGSYHFDEGDNTQLTQAGRRKAEWILTQAPPERRGIYVERANEQQQTAARIGAVQEYAANMSPPSAPIDVQETHLRNEGRPAGAIDAVFTGFNANQPPPKLPESSAGSTDSGN